MKKLMVLGLLLIFPFLCFAQDAVTSASPRYDKEKTASSQRNSPLTLNLQSDKKVYEAGEEVFLNIEWRNVGDRSCVLFYDFQDAIGHLTIKDDLGHKQDFFAITIGRMPCNDRNFFTLEPGKSFNSIVRGKITEPEEFYSRQAPFRPYSEIPYKSAQEAQGFYVFEAGNAVCFLKPGEYQVQYLYRAEKTLIQLNSVVDNSDLFDQVWTGALTSNTIAIEVVE